MTVKGQVCEGSKAMNETAANFTMAFHSLVRLKKAALSDLYILCFYPLSCFVGLLDIFVIYVLVRSGQLRRNISSFLIFHLSFTHLLFHVFFAMTVPNGPLRENSVLMCKMSAFIEHACPAAIFSTLVAIAWDRQKNILQPFKRLVAGSARSYLLVVAGIWSYAAVSSVSFIHSMSPLTYNACRMVNNNTQKECVPYTFCHNPPDWKTQTSETIYFVVAFFLPLSYMLVAYTRIAVRLHKRSRNGMIHSAVAKHKGKSIRLLVAAVLGFVICWGPSILLNLLEKYPGVWPLEREYTLHFLFKYIAPTSSSCINTAIYAFFSPEFRKNCIKFACHCSCCRYIVKPM